MAEASEDLYEICRNAANSSKEGYRKNFNQDELLDMCSKSDSPHLRQVSDAQKLLPLISTLCNKFMFITLKTGSASAWGVRPRKVSLQVQKLDESERMIYAIIESTYEEGAWLRMIKNKSGVKDGPSIDKILRRLQSTGMIQELKTIKVGSQKTYMLSYIQPGVDITGGSFFDAGELDENMVDEVGKIIIFHVRHNSWAQEKQRKLKRDASPIEIHDEDGDEEAEPRGRKKRKGANGVAAVVTNDIEDLASSRKANMQLSFPVGYAYPTAHSIHGFLISTRVLRGGKANSLTVNEVQNVINTLVWDGKLEEVNGGYRTVRGVEPQRPGMDDEETEEAEAVKRGNGLTEAPCGRCPVMDLCGKGRTINAATCVYYKDWLQQSVGIAA